MSPVKRVPTWRAVAHVILVLSLVFNLTLNVNVNQKKEGTHMAKDNCISQQSNSRLHLHNTDKKAGTSCVGVRSRRPG